MKAIQSGPEESIERQGFFPLNRRDFLKTVGGGIIFFFSCGSLSGQQRRPAGARDLPEDFNAFLRIGVDGRVSGFTGKVELGQGVVNSLAQILAEELEVPFASVEMLRGDTDLCPWDFGTVGSRSIRFFGPPLREAAAKAKAILKKMAAERLHVPESRLIILEGVIWDKNDKRRRITYGELAKGNPIQRRLTTRPSLKSVGDYTVVGKDFPRKDSLEKVTGEASYAGDIRVAGILYASILRPPAHGAKRKTLDLSAVEKDPELRIVQDRGLIAFLHPSPDKAQKALSRVKAEFEWAASKLDPQTIFSHLLAHAPPEEIVTRGGNIQEGEKQAIEVFGHTYRTPYVAHAAIETHTALAHIEKERVNVWSSTQSPFRVQESVAKALGIPTANVRVRAPYVGGGFGGKSKNLEAVEAARLAKLTGKPVQVAWTREEEFFYDSFQPATIVKIRSGINGTKQIVFWDFDVYFAGKRGVEQFYAIPHHREASHGHYHVPPGLHPFDTGPWRAPGHNTTAFARESQIDIMAAKMALDPLEFRLRHLTDKRMMNVLRAAARKFGWAPSPAPSRRGHGLACAVDAGAYVATMAEVEMEAGSGKIQVKRIVHAQDMGLAIHPEGARRQMEGCLTMGMGYALAEEVDFKGGQIFSKNFDTYAIPRFSWLPRIETVLVEARDLPPQGGGEPPIVCLGGALANAVFDAIGVRLFELPMTPERVKKEMNRQGR